MPMDDPHSPAPPDTRPATALMAATYALGAVGAFIGYTTLSADPPSLTWAALLAVGGGGLLSFVRHSLFFRSDAARMGWQSGSGQRNNFQIEVGLANLAWGLLAVLAVVFGWGLAVESAAFLTFGFYLAAVAVMLLTTPHGERTRPWRQVIAMGLFAAVLIHLGVLGMAASG